MEVQQFTVSYKYDLQDEIGKKIHDSNSQQVLTLSIRTCVIHKIRPKHTV